MARSPDIPTFAIQDIAVSERIPLKFLEQILLTLKNGGLLRSKRGVGGGYVLARAAAQPAGAVVTVTGFAVPS